MPNPTNKQTLEARIKAGGGEGWCLPEDFDWKMYNDTRVMFTFKGFQTLNIAKAHSFHGAKFIHHSSFGRFTPQDIGAIRPCIIGPDTDALAAMRELSALTKGE